jgi:hypothetical protein
MKTKAHISSARTNSFIAAVLLFCFFVLPVRAFAAVQITEIMYDLPNADSGREWVEITNTGNAPVDISKFKFTEGGANHVLKKISGTSLLAVGESAIVTSDSSKFLADWPAYTGNLFDSTFDLSNAGETLAIKNASSSLEDTISYVSSVGAAGDGGSLHRKGDTFFAALPNPGVYPGEIKSVPVVEKPMPTPVAPKVSKAKNPSTNVRSTATKSTQVAAVTPIALSSFETSQKEKTPSVWVWYAGLAGVVALGAAGALYASGTGNKSFLKRETKDNGEEFEIVG